MSVVEIAEVPVTLLMTVTCDRHRIARKRCPLDCPDRRPAKASSAKRSLSASLRRDRASKASSSGRLAAVSYGGSAAKKAKVDHLQPGRHNDPDFDKSSASGFQSDFRRYSLRQRKARPSSESSAESDEDDDDDDEEDENDEENDHGEEGDDLGDEHQEAGDVGNTRRGGGSMVGGVGGGRIGCPCGRQVDDGRLMFACDRCNVWLHAACVGLERQLLSTPDATVFCPSCSLVLAAATAAPASNSVNGGNGANGGTTATRTPTSTVAAASVAAAASLYGSGLHANSYGSSAHVARQSALFELQQQQVQQIMQRKQQHVQQQHQEQQARYQLQRQQIQQLLQLQQYRPQHEPRQNVVPHRAAPPAQQPGSVSAWQQEAWQSQPSSSAGGRSMWTTATTAAATAAGGRTLMMSSSGSSVGSNSSGQNTPESGAGWGSGVDDLGPSGSPSYDYGATGAKASASVDLWLTPDLALAGYWPQQQQEQLPTVPSAGSFTSSEADDFLVFDAAVVE